MDFSNKSTKMFSEIRCSSHRAQAGHLCLYHKEPLCAECKFNDEHERCPKELIGIKDRIPEPNTERGDCYEQCVVNFTNVLELQQKSSDHNERLTKRLKESLDKLFKEIKLKVNSVQEETESCIDTTITECSRKSSDVVRASNDLLAEIGNHMKGICENTQELTNIAQQAEQYRKVIDKKRKELEACDFEWKSTLALARLLDPEKIVFRQAILYCHLIDSIYPPVADPKLQFIGEVDSKLTSDKRRPLITGCIVLRNGTIALVDHANSSVKLFAADGLLKDTISFEDSSPFDISERDQGFYVSLPKLWKICHVSLAPDNESKRKKYIVTTKNKCYGIEYGGQKLVVSCHLYRYKWIGSLCWQFCVYGGDNQLLQVVEKDRLGEPFYMMKGYFKYCPFRDQVLFLTDDGEAKQFNLTCPSHLESLGPLGSRNGEKITALTSAGSTIITCHTKTEFGISQSTTLRLQNYMQTAASAIEFRSRYPGPMYCDARSRLLVVCEELGMVTYEGRTVYLYKY